MKSFILKLLGIIFSICVLMCIIYQTYFYLKKNYEIMVVKVSTFEKKSGANGIFYKNETVLNFEGYGNIIKNIHPDGTKIGMQSKIARIYKTQEDVKKFEKLEQLKEELLDLKKIQNENFIKHCDFNGLNKRINENYINLLKNINDKDFNKIIDDKKNLTFLFNLKQLMTNKNMSFNGSITSIENEIKKIKQNLNKPKVILSNQSGYFIGNIDGLENECCLENVEKLDIKEFEDYLKKTNVFKVCDGKHAKILTDSKILFKAIMPTKNLVNQKINSSCKIKFKETGEEIIAYLDNAILDFNSENSIAIFEVYDINDKICNLRKSEAEIVFYETEGFKIPKSAIKINNNNEVGAYVVTGAVMKFKKINILFEDSDFAICEYDEKNNKKNDYIKDLDTIIVRGRNLYDNKKI